MVDYLCIESSGEFRECYNITIKEGEISMNRLILLEDDDCLRNHTAELLIEELQTAKTLKELDLTVTEFRRIDQAKEFFNTYKDEIGCIVTDLNMSDEWLGEYQHESFGRILSGWVWLYRFVFPIKPDIPTVIYSGFLDELKANIPSEQRLSLGKTNIECVAKGSDNDEGFSGLVKAIEKVIRRGQHRDDK